MIDRRFSSSHFHCLSLPTRNPPPSRRKQWRFGSSCSSETQDYRQFMSRWRRMMSLLTWWKLWRLNVKIVWVPWIQRSSVCTHLKLKGRFLRELMIQLLYAPSPNSSQLTACEQKRSRKADVLTSSEKAEDRLESFWPWGRDAIAASSSVKSPKVDACATNTITSSLSAGMSYNCHRCWSCTILHFTVSETTINITKNS